MPIQLNILERRDGGSRETMGNTALELCRLVRKNKGITSARFYWSGSEDIVFWVEGEASALDNPDPATLADYSRLLFTLADNARMTLTKRLADQKTSLQTYRNAGR
jgi:hypothetical protein